MRSRTLAFVSVAMILFGRPVLAAEDFTLVTPQEFDREQAARAETVGDSLTRGDIFDQQVWTRVLDAPVIEVLTPQTAQPVQPPVDIRVNFKPAPGATIVLESLKITYGVLGIDVTNRIRKAATVTAHGIEAKGAELPAGSHSMAIEIADSAGRKTRQSFKFRVAGS